MANSNTQLLKELIPNMTLDFIQLKSCKYCNILTVANAHFAQKRCKHNRLNKKHFDAYTCVRCKHKICRTCGATKMKLLFYNKRKVCSECFLNT